MIVELSLAPTIGACSALVGFTHYKAHQMKVIINQNICIWRGVGEGGIFSLILKSERDLTLAVGVRSRLLPFFREIFMTIVWPLHKHGGGHLRSCIISVQPCYEISTV